MPQAAASHCRCKRKLRQPWRGLTKALPLGAKRSATNLEQRPAQAQQEADFSNSELPLCLEGRRKSGFAQPCEQLASKALHRFTLKILRLSRSLWTNQLHGARGNLVVHQDLAFSGRCWIRCRLWVFGCCQACLFSKQLWHRVCAVTAMFGLLTCFNSSRSTSEFDPAPVHCTAHEASKLQQEACRRLPEISASKRQSL